jgi:acyl dehydratase
MTTLPASETPAPAVFEEAKRHVGYCDEIVIGAMHRREFQRFALAVGDTNPLYFDEAAARAAGYDRLVVPPLFLTSVMGWGAGPGETELREDGLAESDSFLIPVRGMRAMGGGQQVEWHAPVLEGVQVTLRRELADVRWRQGRSGPMVLFTVVRRYLDEHGSLLVTCRETFIGR